MEFLPTKELETMGLEELIAYKSLLTHISELKDFPSTDVINNIGAIKKTIELKLSKNMDEYTGVSAKEMSTALMVKTGDTRFLDGILDKLREAREAQEKDDGETSEQEQKQANMEVFKNFYMEMTYSMIEVVSMLGRDTVLKVLDKDTLAQLVGMTKDSGEKPKSSGKNRDVQIEH